MSDAHVAAPSRSAWKTPTFEAWLAPRSSHDRMTSLVSGSCPSRSASVVTVETLTVADGPEACVVGFGSSGGIGEQLRMAVVRRE